MIIIMIIKKVRKEGPILVPMAVPWIWMSRLSLKEVLFMVRIMRIRLDNPNSKSKLTTVAEHFFSSSNHNPNYMQLIIVDLHDGVILLPRQECFVNILCYSDFSSLLGTKKQLLKFG